MDDFKDLNVFYSTTLEPLLSSLQEKGKSVNIWMKIAIGAVTLTVFSFVNLYINFFPYSGIYIVIFLLITVVSVYNFNKKEDNYVEEYKETIVRKIIDHLYPGTVYQLSEYISSKEYKASGLYRRRNDYYYGSDLIQANYKNIQFKCSFLESEFDGSGNKQVTIFSGLFFSAAINSSFIGGTYIWQNNNLQLGDSIADDRYRLMPLPKVYQIKTGDIEFEKYYSCYSSYPSEAQAILTPDMRQAMINLKTQTKQGISFSFVAGRCYAAIPDNENVMEPSEVRIENLEEIKKHSNSILFIFSIIDNLKLYEL